MKIMDIDEQKIDVREMFEGKWMSVRECKLRQRVEKGKSRKGLEK